MTNFDFKKYLAEGKLHEAMFDVATTEKIAQAVADAFTAEDNELDLKYKVTPGTGESSFDLDVEAGPNTPGEDWKDENGFDIENYLGKYAGGSFYIKDGKVFNAANRNSFIANASDLLGIETPGEETDYMQRRKEMDDYTIDENKETKPNKMKKTTVDSKLAEIEKQSQVVALEAKIAAIDEMIETKNQRISMISEDENLSELVDKAKMKVMQREVKDLERRKVKMEKLYEKMCGKSYTKEEIVDEEMSTELNENRKTMKKSELKEMIKAAMMSEINIDIQDTNADYDPLYEEEAEEEVDAEEVDVEVGDEEVETTDVETTAEVDPNVKAVQDALTAAQTAAAALGNEKLTDQIGNTITFFTRQHVANIDKQVSEVDVQDAADDTETKIDSVAAAMIGLNESRNRMLKLAGIIKKL